MTINDIKARLGNVSNIEIAQATCSKGDALTKIVEVIEKKGLDVDEEYLDFIKKVEYENVFVDVKYVPIYFATNIAKLSWKERKEGEDPTDHQEFVRFNALFYARQNNKKDRINNLQILKILDKKVAKPENYKTIHESKLNYMLMREAIPELPEKMPAQYLKCFHF